VREVPEFMKPAGSNIVAWDGRDGNSTRVAPGIYFIRLQAGDQVATRKVVLIR
jgi:hypothetical protein